jgi:phage-related protein
MIRDFPAGARREAGFQIDRVQRGLDPDDWKPIKSVGPGVREIRVRDRAGAFRVIYVATFSDAVFVLHAFQKKMQATPRRDLELATVRFKLLAQRNT